MRENLQKLQSDDGHGVDARTWIIFDARVFLNGRN
jgi:hypothetical protein